MWAAVRALDEGGMLLEQLARHLQEHHDGHDAAILEERAREAQRRADRIRRLATGVPE